MKDIARRLYSINQSYRLEQMVYDRQQISDYELMRRAGQAAFTHIQGMVDPDRPWVIFAGSGNNGGDGYVIASLAIDAGLEVHLCEVGGRKNHTGPAAIARKKALNKPDGHIEWPINQCPADAVIIDAILGIGIDGDVRGMAGDVIDWINYYTPGHPVISVDLPSGLNADTGMPHGRAIIADHTITLLSNKKGLYVGRAPDYTGSITYDQLHLPSGIFVDLAPDLIKMDDRMATAPLPVRRNDSHKGDFGHTLIIGGQYQDNYSMGGATILAGMAANKSGAGRVSIITDPEHITPILSHDPSITPIGLTPEENLKEYLAGKESIALGPGLGQSDWAIDIWKRTMNYAMENNIHIVLDADGLNILADQGWNSPLPNAILTPHPGEAARLLESAVNDIQSDRESAVQKLSKKYQACVVLKGAGSLITAPNQPIFLNPTGNAGLATGGTGDVLTGIIAALLAQGLTPLQAAKSGAFLHGRAGDHAVDQIGKAGITAMDVVDGLTCI